MVAKCFNPLLIGALIQTLVQWMGKTVVWFTFQSPLNRGTYSDSSSNRTRVIITTTVSIPS